MPSQKSNPRGGHPLMNSPTYVSWKSMISRCYRPLDASYVRYGAVGVSVCDRWRDSFAMFVEDMGVRPDGHTLDRIDNAKGYEPSNCRWATREAQSANRASTLGKQKPNRKGRPVAHVTTHCVNGHEYTPENTLVHRTGFRFCRACKREQQHRYYLNRVRPITSRHRTAQ